MTDPLAQWLDEMEAKCRAATPGPWPQKKWSVVNDVGDSVAECCWQRDARYLAALPPETVQALLECVRAADARAQQYPVGVPLTEALARLRRLALGDA